MVRTFNIWTNLNTGGQNGESDTPNSLCRC